MLILHRFSRCHFSHQLPSPFISLVPNQDLNTIRACRLHVGAFPHRLIYSGGFCLLFLKYLSLIDFFFRDLIFQVA